MTQQKIIKINSFNEIPVNFTGIVEWGFKAKFSYKDGKLHQENGPAVEYSDKTKLWYKEGKYYRLDGPAIEYSDGTKEWWIDNIKYSPDYFSWLCKTAIFLGSEKGNYNLSWLRFLTEEEIVEFPIIPGMKEDKIFQDLFNKLDKSIEATSS
jgi:hypothetical protein